MATKEIKSHEAALEKGIRKWYAFLAEQEDEFKRILDEAIPDENGMSTIPLNQVEGFYGLIGYKDNVKLNRAVRIYNGNEFDYYIEADFVELDGNELKVLSHTTLDFDELQDAIILSDVMHSMYDWEYEMFGED